MRKIAFTLAEVLITLAIIGVVAAMTMPTLIANYQKEVTVTQLKKSYSVWSQAFQKILADEGVERLSDTQLWSNLDSNCNNVSCNNFFDGLKKYIKIETPYSHGFEYSLQSSTYTWTNTTINIQGSAMVSGFYFLKNAFHTDESTCNKIKNLGGGICSYVGYIRVDTNGFKKPNIGGKDNFQFLISDEGILYPIGGKDIQLLVTESNITSKDLSISYDYVNACFDNKSNSMSNPTTNLGCTARIMENGWKIDY